MSKLVENFFLKCGTTPETFLSPSVAMGDHNGAMFEVWLVSHTGLDTTTGEGLVGTLEASNDGLYWTPVPTFPTFAADDGTPQLHYLPVQDTDIVIPQAYIRLKFVIKAESAAATALLHADIRTYRAS
jgi:hypothetical protein